jgi:alkyl hydroperoxide reductase subunit D
MDVIKETIPDFAKDIKINLSNVLTELGSPGLTGKQIAGVALASAYAVNVPAVRQSVEGLVAETLSPEEVTAAKSAATIMAMTNVYYRSLHYLSDSEYSSLPAKLRMTVIGNPGIAKTDFELYSLAVSAVNGCQYCVDAHAVKVTGGGISKEGVQSVIRIAAVIVAYAQAVSIGN